MIHIENINVFLESITIASACNKVLRKRFLKPDTIGLIPTGGYTSNNKFSKSPLCGWFIGKRQTVVRYYTAATGVSTDCQNFPTWVWTVSVQRQKLCEFCGFFWHGRTCLPFRDVTTVAGETLAERYEHTMARIGQIMRAAYEIEFMCECDFDVGIHTKLKRTWTGKIWRPFRGYDKRTKTRGIYSGIC